MKMSEMKKCIAVSGALMLALVLLYGGFRMLKSTAFQTDPGTVQTGMRQTIVRDGVEYFPRQDVTVVLLTGIGETGPVQDSGSRRNCGEADMVSLLIFDKGAQKLNILSLNRDTMLDIQSPDLNGKSAGTGYGQLALAHTYGSGLEDSSENLRNTVSAFLYGANIDYYVTLNMDAIALLNDAVGGVTVTVVDDFSQADPTIPTGEVTLQGQQAVSFVCAREGVGSQLSLSRMERHKEYMSGFMEALKSRLEIDPGFASGVYEDVCGYMVTDCSVKVQSLLLKQCGQYSLGQIVTIAGEYAEDGQSTEYYVNQEDLDRVILEYLYAPKK